MSTTVHSDAPPEIPVSDREPVLITRRRLPRLPVGWAILVGSVVIAGAVWMRPFNHYALSANGQHRINTVTGDVEVCTQMGTSTGLACGLDLAYRQAQEINALETQWREDSLRKAGAPPDSL